MTPRTRHNLTPPPVSPLVEEPMATGGRRTFPTRPRRKTPYRGGAAPQLYTGDTHRHAAFHPTLT